MLVPGVLAVQLPEGQSGGDILAALMLDTLPAWVYGLYRLYQRIGRPRSMTPRKRQYESSTARGIAYRERQRAVGKRQIGLWLSEKAIKALDRLAKEGETDRSEIIERLILKK